MSHRVHPKSKSLELTRLINAMTSINHYNNLLILTILLDIDSKLISLGELAGQLGGFVGDSESVKKAVVNAIIAVFDTNPHLKNDLKHLYSPYVTNLSVSVNSAGQADDTKIISELKDKVTSQITETKRLIDNLNNHLNPSLSSPSPSADPAKLQSKLEALRKVEELCGFLTNPKNASNDPKKLLDNLCDGLETFLGFNSASKGYDGAGIVYSDLDRLCDGVMGFLSGVLSNIKEHLGQHKEQITEAIKSLETNKHLGKKGFNDAIGKVVAGVRGYNKEVKKSNNNVRYPIDKLLKDLENDGTFDKAYKKIYAESVTGNPEDGQVKAADNLAEQSLKLARDFLGALHESEERDKAVSDLNHDCRNNVNNARKIIKHEHDRLQMNFGNESNASRNMVEAVIKEITGMNANVNKQIDEKVAPLINELKKKMQEFLEQVENGPKKDLGRWLKEETETTDQGKKSKKDAFAASRDKVYAGVENFETNYHDIHPQLEAIKGIVQKSNSTEKLEESVAKITSAVKDVGEQLGLQVKSLEHWRTTALEVVKVALKRVDEIVNKLDGKKADQEAENSERDEVTKAAGELKDQALKLMTAITEATGKLSTGIATAGRAVTDLDDALKKSLHSLKTRIKTTISQYIGKLSGALDAGMQSTRGYSGTAGFSAFMSNFNSEHPISPKTEFGKRLQEVGRNNIKLARGIHTALIELNNEKSQWSRITPGSNELQSAISKDLQDSVDKELPDAEDDEKVLLTSLVSYSATGATGSKQWLEKSISSMQESVKGKLDNIVYPEKTGKMITAHMITTTHHELNIKFKSFIRAVTNIIKKDPHMGSNEHLNYDLRKLNAMLDGKESIYGINNHLNTIHTALSAIHKKEFGEQLSNSSVYGAISVVTDKVIMLEKASTATDTPDGNLMKLVGSLPKDMRSLNNCINTVIEVVENADKQLQQWITNVGVYIATMDKTGHDFADGLKEFVDVSMSYAKNIITTDIQKGYVRSVKRQLKYFAIVAHDVLTPLPALVEQDKHIGFKGFMEEFAGKTPENENIQKLVEQKENSNVEKLSAAFQQFWKPLKNYLITEIKRVNTENNEKKNPVGTDQQYYSHTLLKINDSLADLLDHLGKQNRYDHNLHGLLQKLISANNELKPDNFAKPNTPVLDGIGSGISKFVDELRKVYISTYDSVSFDGVLFDNHRYEVTPRGAVSTYYLSGYGKKCAKVFITTLEMLSNDFYTLIKESMKSWKARQINTYNDNLFGKWLEDRGYKVDREKGKQTGELQNKSDMTVTTIYDILSKNIRSVVEVDTQTSWMKDIVQRKKARNENANQINVVDILLFLYEQVQIYYKVSHYNVPSKPKAPSSVKDMLQWLIGLPHTTVYNELTVGGFGELFDRPEEEKLTDESGPTLKLEDDDKLDAYPATITAVNLRDTLTEVCHYSYDVLVSLLGHGHAGGRYACEFNTNEDKFSYPNDMNALICSMLDILTRLHEQLYFLCRQCHYTTDLSGWANCWYGRDVGGASWKCNALQCPDQSADQIHNQTCNQKCNQISDCGLKSPLQSFLEDGLQGFLPHQLKVERGALVCTVKHSGLPCKTPMGFGDISQLASHRQQGKHIFTTLYKFCGSKSSPLTRLRSQLKCILPNAPKTLNDMFAFYFTLLNDWNEAAGTRQMHRENAFKKAVIEANFENHNTELDITAMFKNRDHGLNAATQKSEHITGDLYALVDCHTNSSSVSSHPCGPYLRPICQDGFSTFTAKNAEKYVSWIIYSTGSFLHLLKQLYEECNSNCAGDRPKCRVSRCKKGCKALDSPMSPGSTHEKSCGSIVDCKLMRPTIYKYGFVLGDCESLSAESSKRTCKDLCMVLQSVTNEKESAHHPLAELVYRTIPDFLFTIRAPFIWLNVALWLLSFLYLLHIMVIRLDLLHIKSHLHSPSSHRIAAQSLLAAGRVNKLGRVFYLQP
ncbi:hypothetical protein, conserved [Babesia bigemina]|uniref:C3H1-type domain-containing protein n=1 Tax=Babesia bigemina TaxID=5866 RepID=A0A061BK96_BABBI|nr:hypothetical protein, conserved [Babesia bigemina]CDR71867.1 hypothetical protein, conserved [Babesia bigemina]|eukprot:XP_012770810.1 hypothetical protein, conserved [Babesia bigemina]